MIPQKKTITRRVFSRLSRPSEEGMEFTRNRVRRESLYPLATAEQVNRVLGRLADADLLRVTPGETREEDRVEVTHEALIRNWPSLVKWLEEDRERLKDRLRLAAAAQLWKAHNEDPGGLLGGSLLKEALRYDDLDPLETNFIRASEAAERDRAVAQKRQLWRLKIGITVLAVLFFLFMAAVTYAWVWKDKADKLKQQRTQDEIKRVEKERKQKEAAGQLNKEQLARVIASRIAQLAQENPTNPDRGLLLGLMAQRALANAGLSLTPGVREALERSLSDAKPIRTFSGDTGYTQSASRRDNQPVFRLIFSPDGKYLAANMGEKMQLWDVASGKLLCTLEQPRWFYAMAFSQDGTQVMTGSEDGLVIVWETKSGKEIRRLSGHTKALYAVAFSPDGQRLAAGGEDGTVRLWDAAGSQELFTLPGSVAKEPIYALAFDRTGERLALAGANGARVCNLYLTFAQKLRGLWLTLGTRPEEVAQQLEVFFGKALYKRDAGRALLPLNDAGEDLSAIAFSPDGKWLATTGVGGTVGIWDAQTGQLQFPISGEELPGVLSTVSFTPAGQLLVTYSERPRVVLWDVAAARPVYTAWVPIRQGTPTAYALHPNATQVAVALLAEPGRQAALLPAADSKIQLFPIQSIFDPVGQAQKRVKERHVRLTFSDYLEVLQPLEENRWRQLGAIHDQFVKGRLTNLAEEVQKAREEVEKSLSLPGFQDDAAEEAKRLVAELVVARGRDLLLKLQSTDKSADLLRQTVAQAADFFREALQLNPALKDRSEFQQGPEAYAKSLAANELVSRGRDLTLQAAVDQWGDVSLRNESVAQAADLFRRALELSPALASGPELQQGPDAYARSLAASALLRRGRDLAAQVVVTESGQAVVKDEPIKRMVSLFRQALELNPSLKDKDDLREGPEALANSLAARAVLDQARTLAFQAAVVQAAVVQPDQVVVKKESVDRVVALCRQALKLNPRLDGDPQFKKGAEDAAKSWAAQGVVQKALSFAEQGKIDEALNALDSARKYVPDLSISALSWNELCWWGSLHGRAKDVLFAGDEAVKLTEEKDGGYRDSRGLARALTGDTKGAIDDFEAYIAWAKDDKRNEKEIAKRREWIKALHEGKNPFTPQVLQGLRTGHSRGAVF